jgi:classical protein kinase C
LPVQRKRLEHIAQHFVAMDVDGSGDIDLQEVANALEAIGKPKSQRELKAAVRRVDDDDSGTLRYWE